MKDDPLQAYEKATKAWIRANLAKPAPKNYYELRRAVLDARNAWRRSLASEMGIDASEWAPDV